MACALLLNEINDLKGTGARHAMTGILRVSADLVRRTWVRLALAASMAACSAIAMAQLSACSTNQPRDVNYGTDVGLFYVPPGVDNTVSDDAASVDADGGDSADSVVVDGGASAETSVGSAL
jgi:hypothetical protein